MWVSVFAFPHPASSPVMRASTATTQRTRPVTTGSLFRDGGNLKPGAVDLVAGRLGGQALVRDVDRAAVVDDAVHLAGDRHVHAVALGELHDHARGLDALGHLVHRREDLLDRLSGADLLAAAAGAAARAGGPG